MKLHDPICEYCDNRELSCKTPCAPIKWINGHTARREPLLEDLKNKPSLAADYNMALAELIKDRESAINKLLSIANVRKRAILSMLVVDITRKEVATLLSMSYKQITRIINDNNK